MEFRAHKEITSQSETARKLPRIGDRKPVHISNIDRLGVVDPRGFGAISDAVVISLRALSRGWTMRLFSSYLVGSLALAMLSGCVCSDNRKHDTKKDSDKDDQSKQSSLFAPVGGEASKSTDQNITKAVAVINPLVDNSVKGKVTFTKVEGGVLIVADLDGLKPGEHGFHVHEYGDCGKAGMAAGAHFNPNNGKHGGPDSPDRHVGDLGNIVADAKGHAHYERVDKLIKLEGRNSIVGRSIIIHADKDDYVSQPAGASGAKIACGIIQAVSD